MRAPTSIVIDRGLAGRTLLAVLQSSLRLSNKAALQAVRNRQVRISGGVCIDPARRLKVGQHVQIQRAPVNVEASRLPANAGGIVVRHADEQIIVVEKPAGLTTVRHAGEVASLGARAKKFLPPTLVDLLPAVLKQRGVSLRGRVRAVHRLDKETSGLMVLARTAEAESRLGKEFRAHTVGRHYLALVRGRPGDERIESHLVPDRGDGRRGSGAAAAGQLAVTYVRLVEALGEFSLVECRLETGRTHQVRIHLGERGTPLCGERVYDRPLNAAPLPDTSKARRPMLHAAYLSVKHPHTGKYLEWHADMPQDMQALLEKLRSAIV
jgi:23S rRNA pseudouridine1911/1915/1917 synthase